MVEAINSWLANGSNYAEGLSIFDKHGQDIFLKILLKKGETPLNRQKLSEALVTLRDTAPPEPVPAPAAPPVPVPAAVITPPAQSPAPAAPQLPAILQLTKQRDQTHAEMRMLHPSLSILPEGEELREVAARLVRLGKKNAELWERYNYLTEGGQDPDEPAPAPPVMVDLNLLNKRELIRKSLNKAENRIKGVAKPHPNTIELIAERRQQLEEIDAKIAAVKKEAGQ